MRPVLWMVILITSMCALARADNPGGTLALWRQHRDAVLEERGLVRLYTFEGAGPEFANLAGAGAPLSYVTVPGQPDEPLTVVQGRWPGKQAVRLDRGVLSAEPFEVGPSGFTVELWFRKSGPGALRGNSDATNGTLVSQGTGYWDGWRVTTSYPEQTLGFELGRPQPSSSFGFFGAGPLPDGAWHHLAATWDGKEMRLYLNGMLAQSAAYAGPYAPPKPGDRFRIGYADSGWGSTKLEVDEVAVWDRALSADQVLRHSLFYEQPGAAGRRPDTAAVSQLRLAEQARAAGDSARAAGALTTVLTAPGVSDRYVLSAMLPLTQLARSAPDTVSVAALERLGAPPGMSERDRYELRLALARSFMAHGQPARARSHYQALMADPQTGAEERRTLLLEMGHGMRAEGDAGVALEVYRRVFEDRAAPVHVRSYAALLMADCYKRMAGQLSTERDYHNAIAAYRAVLAMPGVPDSHRMEAEETLREIPRLRRGLPGRDPAWFRVRVPADPKPGVTLHVAPNGSDRSPGTAQRRLGTLEGAVAAVRRLKARGPLPKGGVAILFHGGRYPSAKTVQLAASDSGTSQAPIVYRAAPGETPVFTGGLELTRLSPVTDPAVTARIPVEARPFVRQIDLKATGVPTVGPLPPHGMGFTPSPVTELYYEGRALPLARWPNTGWATTGKVVSEKAATGGFTFHFDSDRPARWAGAKNAFVYGYWRWLWADSGVGLASVDPVAHTLTTAQGAAYGIQAGMPWYAYNLLEELDKPGEWVLDPERQMVYVYPPKGTRAKPFELSVFSGPFVEMDGTSNVRLEHLTFELGRGDGIHLKGGSRCLFAGCTLRKLGGTAITVDGGDHHGVFGCDLGVLGRGGVAMKGGDRKTLTPSGHFVENCHIHDFSRWDRTYTPAVQADGVAIRIAHNLMHDSPGHAMRLEGNDHLVELNEIHHVVGETDDQGGLDMWFNPTYRGVVIRHNFWHHIGDPAGPRMRAGIRLDDAISGVVITGNVFWKASEGYFGGVQIHGGKENIVENNLFIDCKFGISFSRWGADRWAQFLKSPEVVKATQQDVDIAKPPFSTRYPALAHLAENPDVNNVWRNVAYRCGDFLTRDGGVESLMDNLVTSRDPDFADAGRGNLALKPGSWIYSRLGFWPIPFQEIGRYAHPLAVQVR